MVELSIGIPTANRPEKIIACLESINRYLTIPHKIIVVDSSSINLRLRNVNRDYVDIVYPHEVVSPSHARKIISDNCQTKFLLYLDDDMEIRGGSVEMLVEYLQKNEEADIVGGAVNEYGRWRDLGFQFLIGKKGGRKVIEKKYVSKRWLERRGYDSFEVDIITQPPLLTRSRIFEYVSFDPNYRWAVEIYDFFYQCRLAKFRSYVVPSAVFAHFPSSYEEKTYKHQKETHNREGLKYFQQKWGVSIQKPFKQSLVREYIDEWNYRKAKKRMVKKKITSDGIQ